MSAIIEFAAARFLDSRGNPTIEVEVKLESGASGRAAVPSGASTGRARGGRAARRRQEAATAARAWQGGGQTSTANLRPAVGLDATDQIKIDRAMTRLDGTPTRSAGRQRAAGRQPSRGAPRRRWTLACRSTATSAAATPTRCPSADEHSSMAARMPTIRSTSRSS